jgi:hypothetical protein
MIMLVKAYSHNFIYKYFFNFIVYYRVRMNVKEKKKGGKKLFHNLNF